MKRQRENCINYQKHALAAVRQIFEDERSCSPCPKPEGLELREKLAEAEAKLLEDETNVTEMAKKYNEMAKGKFEFNICR